MSSLSQERLSEEENVTERQEKTGKVSVCRESKASHENYNGKKLKGCHEKLMMQETSGKI